MQEPRDGDFVAYIEALQRESAARLAGQRSRPADPGDTPAPSGHGFDDGSQPPRSTSFEQALTRFVRDGDARVVKAVVAAVLGAMFLLMWVGSGSTIAFLLAVALLAYAVPRLLRTYRAGMRPPSNRAAVDHVFGRGGSRSNGPEP